MTPRRLILISLTVLATACGQGALPAKGSPSTQQALTGTAEWLEYETPATRAELFREVARTSQAQASRRGAGQMLFPMLVNGNFVAAPAIDPRADLLMAADAGQFVQLILEDKGDRFADDRRDSFQGLSEREATELVARSLIQLWGLKPSQPVRVERAANVPYAAAYLDGVLKVNPAFVYLATANP